jgi:hypothetical protein
MGTTVTIEGAEKADLVVIEGADLMPVEGGMKIGALDVTKVKVATPLLDIAGNTKFPTTIIL